MARPLRIEYHGAWYHVLNRGAGRGCVFPDDELRRAFLHLLGDVHERFSIRCHAYCLMDNHYHLLLHTPTAGLGRAMRHVDGVYTQHHNRSRKTDGPLFRGRYKAQIIEDGDYLWFVSRYIHRNPVEARLCSFPAEYRWSSYQHFAGTSAAPVWLQRGKTLRQFGGAAAYCSFVESNGGPSQHEQKFLSEQDGQRCASILGSDEFVEELLRAVSKEYEIPESNPPAGSTPLTAIFEALCVECGWHQTKLISGSDKTQRLRRAMLMSVLVRHTPARLAQIAALFDLHYSTAATAISRVRKAAEHDRNLAGGMQQLRALLQKMRNGQT